MEKDSLPSHASVLLGGKSIDYFLSLSSEDAWKFVSESILNDKKYENVIDAVSGLEQRLKFLNEVGLGYLTLDRSYSSLSGGEAQRARLATQLGMGLVGVIYALDEPSVGLHPSDNGRLLKVFRGFKR